MKNNLKIILLSLILIVSFSTFGQNRGIYYFRFQITDRQELSDLTRQISIDDVKGNDVSAFATAEQFERFRKLGYDYTMLPLPGSDLTETDLGTSGLKDASGRTIWNFYPSYQQYLDFMAGFAASYPEICRIDTIGVSGQGRLILAAKISDSVNEHQGEPEILLTSSIHGDEITGYICMMHLIDSLLTSYNVSDRITGMINNYQIYINPLANPDGTYHGGNNSVSGAWRYNANYVDLNRNFPDPDDGPHPDGNAWQVETKAFMRYDTLHRFVISMNFHGGAEVYNYPWDTWSKFHPDDAWWQFTGREYADTIHAYAPPGYFTDLNNGITNGYAWYTITGGRQDYTTYFHYGREVTLEISAVKLPPANQLLNFWNYNKRSFLNFIDQAYYGINGQITDSLTGEPLGAKVNIWGHDADNSFVFSDPATGWYFRPIYEGTWGLTITSSGYRPKTITANAAKWTTARENIQLVPVTYGTGDIQSIKAEIFPNPSKGTFRIMLSDNPADGSVIRLYTLSGTLVMEKPAAGKEIMVDAGAVSPGVYMVELKSGNAFSRNRVVIMR